VRIFLDRRQKLKADHLVARLVPYPVICEGNCHLEGKKVHKTLKKQIVAVPVVFSVAGSPGFLNQEVSHFSY